MWEGVFFFFFFFPSLLVISHISFLSSINTSLIFVFGDVRLDQNYFVKPSLLKLFLNNIKPEDHWSCIAHLIAEDMLKSAVIEEKKFKSIECK